MTWIKYKYQMTWRLLRLSHLISIIAHVAFLWYQVMCCQEQLGKGCIILVYSKNGQEAQHGGMTAFLSSFP